MKKFILVMILSVLAASSYATDSITTGQFYLAAGLASTNRNDSTAIIRARSMSVIIGPVTSTTHPTVTITVYLINGDTRIYTFGSSSSSLAPATQFDIYNFGTRSDSVNISRSDSLVNVTVVPYHGAF